MTDTECLERYIPMVDFIADICGSNYEVLLHDVSKPEASVIAIRNGHHSGRTIGSPMTELALRILKNKEYETKDYIANYSGNTKDRQFYSSTYYIKNEGRLVGMLCINNDMTPLNDLKHAFNVMASVFDFEKKDEEYVEAIDSPLESLANSIVSKTISSYHVSPSRMSSDEKREIVQRLNNQGVLLLKGAISEIAMQLNISEATVYRYLNKK